MMNGRLFAGLTLATALATTMLGSPSSQAVDADDLLDFYIGSAHHSTNSDADDVGASLDIQTRQINGGKFTAILSEVVTVSGKVSASGKITFSGSSANNDLKIKQGKGQLSATGQFIVGSFKAQGNSALYPAGSYTLTLQPLNE